MLQSLHRTARKIRMCAEAARREMRQVDRIADHAELWPLAQFNREYRYHTRLYRLAQGVSPWRPHRGI